jgi:thioester reductase-like protein
MGVAVSTRALYRASTLAAMARTVQEAREAATDAVGDPEDIDWAAEAAVPAWLKQQVREVLQESTEEPAATATPTRRTGDGLEIVLTGATGFLGGRILHMLLQSSAVRTVHCIAVLADDAHLLPKENRIRCYTGSLADPTLGLSAAEHALLSQTSDVIIHAGSDGHCLNNYATLRAPNVASTQQLAALALPRAVPLLFVSSYRVALLGGRTAQPAASMAACPPPGDGREGLTASKWVAETFLENLAGYYYHQQQRRNIKAEQQRKWTVAVHRPCVVVGEQAPNSDSMNAILRFSLSMHCVPLLKRGRGYIDFAPADGVAAGVAQAGLRMAVKEEDINTAVDGHVQFKHHSSNTRVPVDGFGAHLEKVYGGRFEELPMRDWMGRASAAGIDPLITAYLDGVMDTDEEMVFPYLGEDE